MYVCSIFAIVRTSMESAATAMFRAAVRCSFRRLLGRAPVESTAAKKGPPLSGRSQVRHMGDMWGFP